MTHEGTISNKERNILVTGLASKKSIAFHTIKQLLSQEAKVMASVQTPEIKERMQKHFPEVPLFVCDVTEAEQMHRLQQELIPMGKLHGLVHSMAFANFYGGEKKFHEYSWQDFSLFLRISWFSLIELSNLLREQLAPKASVVTLSISDTNITSYGPLGPIKAMLDQTVSYLAHSFREYPGMEVRFNALCCGPLKTGASAAIPNFMANYLYAEQLTLRRKALKTEEVAQTLCFLLSPAASGINGQRIVVDAGMSCNYFDETIVNKTF